MTRISFLLLVLFAPLAQAQSWAKVPVYPGAATTWRKVPVPAGATDTWRKIQPVTELSVTAGSALNFGALTVGAGVGPQCTTIKNTGTEPVTPALTPVSPFSLNVATTCSGTLAAGNSCNYCLVPSTAAPYASGPKVMSITGAPGVPTFSATVTVSYANCWAAPWGTINHGNSVTAYAVSSGASCPSQVRTCSNGSLSGSYGYGSCTVVASYAWDVIDAMSYDGGIFAQLMMEAYGAYPWLGSPCGSYGQTFDSSTASGWLTWRCQ